jgi:hypothetical protein
LQNAHPSLFLTEKSGVKGNKAFRDKPICLLTQIGLKDSVVPDEKVMTETTNFEGSVGPAAAI